MDSEIDYHPWKDEDAKEHPDRQKLIMTGV